jgi:hypothetical protein
MCVISSAEDIPSIAEADVSVGILTRYKLSLSLITCDMVMKDLYPITYILFKHGTISHRRLYTAT